MLVPVQHQGSIWVCKFASKHLIPQLQLQGFIRRNCIYLFPPPLWHSQGRKGSMFKVFANFLRLSIENEIWIASGQKPELNNDNNVGSAKCTKEPIWWY